MFYERGTDENYYDFFITSYFYSAWIPYIEPSTSANTLSICFGKLEVTGVFDLSAGSLTIWTGRFQPEDALVFHLPSAEVLV